MGSGAINMRWLVLTLALLVPSVGWCQSDNPFEPLPKPDETVDMDHMHFSLVKKGKINIVFMFGAIELGDAERFRTALDLGKASELWLYSGGGNLAEGIAIGRIVRKYKLTTRIPAGMKCISACNFIFLGGTVRYVDTSGVFGVHMFANQNQALMVRDNMLSPPRDIGTFNQRYRNHDPITIDNLKKELGLKEMPKGQEKPGLEDGMKVALGVYAKRFGDNKPVSCPEKEPDGTPEQPQPLAQAPAPAPRQPESMRHSAAHILDQEKPVPKKEEKKEEEQIVDFPNDSCLESLLLIYLDAEAASEEAKNMLQSAAEVSAGVAQFLTEMSVSLRFLTQFATIPNDRWRALTIGEMRSLNVVNTD